MYPTELVGLTERRDGISLSFITELIFVGLPVRLSTIRCRSPGTTFLQFDPLETAVSVTVAKEHILLFGIDTLDESVHGECF